MPKVWECGDVVTADALNNIEQGIQQALDGGGGASRILLYENDALDISSSGQSPIIYTNIGRPNGILMQPTFINDEPTLSLEIDGNIVYSGAIDLTTYGWGIENPGDSSSVESEINGGGRFDVILVANTPATETIACLTNIYVNSNIIPAGTHSVKIYKEPTAEVNQWK